MARKVKLTLTEDELAAIEYAVQISYLDHKRDRNNPQRRTGDQLRLNPLFEQHFDNYPNVLEKIRVAVPQKVFDNANGND